MMIDLPYVQPRKGRHRYRRKVPAELQPILGKTEIIIPLGKKDAEFLKRYDKAHADAERLLSQRKQPAAALPMTERELFRWAEEHVGTLNPVGDQDYRESIAENIAARYPVDDEGYPLAV